MHTASSGLVLLLYRNVPVLGGDALRRSGHPQTIHVEAPKDFLSAADSDNNDVLSFPLRPIQPPPPKLNGEAETEA